MRASPKKLLAAALDYARLIDDAAASVIKRAAESSKAEQRSQPLIGPRRPATGSADVPARSAPTPSPTPPGLGSPP